MQSSLPNPQNTPPVNLLPTQPLGVGEIIDRSFRLYRRHFKVFFVTAAIVVLPLALLTGIFTQTAMQGQMSLLQTMINQGISSVESIEDFSTVSSGSIGMQFLLSILSLVGYFLTYLALTVLALRTLRGSEASVSLAWKGAGEFFWPGVRMGILAFLAFLGVTIAMVIVVMIISLLGAGIFGGLMSGLDSGGGDAAAAIGVFVALCCLMPIFFVIVVGPYIYLGSRWSVSTAALVDVQGGTREALRTSWRLTQGSVWRVIGFLVLIYVLSFILLAIPTYIVLFVSAILAGTQSVWLAAVAGSLFSTLLSILWSPLASIFPVLLYFDLRLRQSGGDIGSRLDRLEASLDQPRPTAPAYTYTPPATATPPVAPPPTPSGSATVTSVETPPPATLNIPSSWDPIAPDDPSSDEPGRPGTE